MALSVSSDVDICANALRLLGDDPIASLTEDSERARLCNALYNPSRDAVLRAHPWNPTLSRVQLPQNATAPVWDFDYAYTLPSDPYCLRVLRTDSGDRFAWKIEGRNLLTNASSVKILYIARITDVSLYDANLIDAITHRLAAKLAYPVTGSLEKAKGFFDLYREIVNEARSIDGLEGTPDTLDDPELVTVRN